jgi:chemotaxis protein MotB
MVTQEGFMRIGTALVLAAFATGCVTQGTYKKKAAEAAKYQAELEAETAKRSALQSEFDAAQADLKAALARASELEQGVTQLAQKKQQLEAAKAELEAKSSEYQKLATSLRGEIAAGRIELSELRGRMTVKMRDKVLFSSGSATLNREGKESLRALASALAEVPDKVIRVEGHTDNVPIGSARFPTNWELSTARALAVVRFLQDAGVDPTKLGAAGYGEYQPVAPNDTPEGRSQNRRIEIVLAPAEVPVVPEPAATQ